MRVRSGTVGWVLLTGYVVGWDYWAARRNGETLSSGFRRAVHHPVTRWPIIAAWGVTTLHLFGALNPDRDPFVLVGRKLIP